MSQHVTRAVPGGGGGSALSSFSKMTVNGEGIYASSASADVGLQQIDQIGLTLSPKITSGVKLSLDCMVTDQDLEDALKQLEPLLTEAERTAASFRIHTIHSLSRSNIATQAKRRTLFGELSKAPLRKRSSVPVTWPKSQPLVRTLPASAKFCKGGRDRDSKNETLSLKISEPSLLSIHGSNEPIQAMQKDVGIAHPSAHIETELVEEAVPQSVTFKRNHVAPSATHVVSTTGPDCIALKQDIHVQAREARSSQASWISKDRTIRRKSATCKIPFHETIAWDPDVPIPSIEKESRSLDGRCLTRMQSSETCRFNKAVINDLRTGLGPAPQDLAGVRNFSANLPTKARAASHKSLPLSQNSSQRTILVSLARLLLQSSQRASSQRYLRSLSTHQIPAELRKQFDTLLKKFQKDQQFCHSVLIFAMELAASELPVGKLPETLRRAFESLHNKYRKLGNAEGGFRMSLDKYAEEFLKEKEKEALRRTDAQLNAQPSYAASAHGQHRGHVKPQAGFTVNHQFNTQKGFTANPQLNSQAGFTANDQLHSQARFTANDYSNFQAGYTPYDHFTSQASYPANSPLYASANHQAGYMANAHINSEANYPPHAQVDHPAYTSNSQASDMVQTNAGATGNGDLQPDVSIWQPTSLDQAICSMSGGELVSGLQNGTNYPFNTENPDNQEESIGYQTSFSSDVHLHAQEGEFDEFHVDPHLSHGQILHNSNSGDVNSHLSMQSGELEERDVDFDLGVDYDLGANFDLDIESDPLFVEMDENLDLQQAASTNLSEEMPGFDLDIEFDPFVEMDEDPDLQQAANTNFSEEMPATPLKLQTKREYTPKEGGRGRNWRWQGTPSPKPQQRRLAPRLSRSKSAIAMRAAAKAAAVAGVSPKQRKIQLSEKDIQTMSVANNAAALSLGGARKSWEAPVIDHNSQKVVIEIDDDEEDNEMIGVGNEEVVDEEVVDEENVEADDEFSIEMRAEFARQMAEDERQNNAEALAAVAEESEESEEE